MKKVTFKSLMRFIPGQKKIPKRGYYRYIKGKKVFIPFEGLTRRKCDKLGINPNLKFITIKEVTDEKLKLMLLRCYPALFSHKQTLKEIIEQSKEYNCTLAFFTELNKSRPKWWQFWKKK